MPCVVPNCDPKGQSFAVHFPQSYLLSQRWKQAIELGSGVALADDVNLLEAQVCQQHFSEFDEYSEPIIFVNNGGGGDAAASSSASQEIRLSCCQLCLQFVSKDQIMSNWEKLALGDRNTKEVLLSVLKLEHPPLSANYFDGICQPCYVQLDLVATTIGELCGKADLCRQMKCLIEAEKSVRLKSSSKRGATEKEEPIEMESELIVCKVEETEEEPNQFDNLGEGSGNAIETELILCKAENDEEELKTLSSDDQEQGISHTKKPRAKKSRKTRSFKDPNTGDEYGKKEKVYLRKLTNKKCYLCVKVFDSNDDLLAHLLDHDDTTLVCQECNETCCSLITYNRHLAKHDCNERPFKCKHCYKRYASPKAKQNHEAIAHQDGEKVTYARRSEQVYTCQHCGKSCPTKSALQQHEDSHIGLKRYKCTICDKSFANPTSLERHHRTHTSLKQFVCKDCGKLYRSSSSYEEHLRSNCQPRTSNTCKFCLAEFTKHCDLVDHTLHDHSNEQVEIIQCDLCDQRFLQDLNYRVHMKEHSKEIKSKKYSCPECGKAFTSGFFLRAHQVTHTGERNFKCSICPKTFTNVSNLNRHVGLHRGDKKFQCDVCDKKFQMPNTLAIHKRTHTGEKPFECQQCGKRFSDPSTLWKHRKNVCKE